MRHFLPIKGPGGRALTTKEKAALVILSVTLILLVLTLLAGDRAFGDEPARNPVFGLVSSQSSIDEFGFNNSKKYLPSFRIYNFLCVISV